MKIFLLSSQFMSVYVLLIFALYQENLISLSLSAHPRVSVHFLGVFLGL